MGKYEDGIRGPFSGKVGNIIGSSSRGVHYMRVAGKTSKAPSEAQLLNRKAFSLVMNWLKPILRLINLGFQMEIDGKTPMNRAIGLHLKEAVVKDKHGLKIDYARAILSKGILLVSWIREILILAEAVLQIQWENPPGSVYSDPADQTNFIIYNPAKDQFSVFEYVATREDKLVNLQLPKDFAGDRVHCWMGYVSADGKQVSTSIYAGSFIIS